MKNNLMQTTDNAGSMTSQEIAVLCNKRHDNVKRVVEDLVATAVIELPQIEEVKNHLGQSVSTYVFTGEQGQRDSIVIVARLSPKFTGALVDRWQELERQASTPAFQIPKTLGAALQLAADQALQIEQDKPKVDFFNSVAASNNLMAVSDVSKKLCMSPNALNLKLITLKVYDRRRLPKKVFNQWFIDKGYGRVTVSSNGYDSSKITHAGQAWIVGLLASGYESPRQLEMI